jgi:hypothetical protein
MPGPPNGPGLLAALRGLVSGRRDLRLADFTQREIDWAIYNGLGPLLHRVTEHDPQRRQSPRWPQLLSADLTARVETGEQIAAMVEILDQCQGAYPLILLKGIVLGQELYPEPHLRPMGDLDVLVAEDAVREVEAALLRLGYLLRQPAGNHITSGHHHGVPFWHPGNENWVEVHWGLVPATSGQEREPAFLPETVFSETRSLVFHGRQTRCLSLELQLLHLTSHWVRGIPLPGGMVGLADLALLLARSEPLDWQKISLWLQGPTTAVHLYLLLTYLTGRNLATASPQVLETTRRRQGAFGRPSLGLLHWLIDRHVVAGVPFKRPITEPVFRTLWEELSRPAPAWRNLVGLARFAVPARARG